MYSASHVFGINCWQGGVWFMVSTKFSKHDVVLDRCTKPVLECKHGVACLMGCAVL